MIGQVVTRVEIPAGSVIRYDDESRKLLVTGPDGKDIMIVMPLVFEAVSSLVAEESP